LICWEPFYIYFSFSLYLLLNVSSVEILLLFICNVFTASTIRLCWSIIKKLYKTCLLCCALVGLESAFCCLFKEFNVGTSTVQKSFLIPFSNQICIRTKSPHEHDCIHNEQGPSWNEWMQLRNEKSRQNLFVLKTLGT
jgi:hypothetical protein